MGDKGKGIIFMFDEGDFLSENKILLEIFRNLFQETKKIGLIIAGTYNLLDDVSDVYSPTPRFFRKIDLGPYPSDDYVTEAIDKPFELANEEFSKETGMLLNHKSDKFKEDLINLTKNMPMQINMLSYFAFEDAASRFDRRQSAVVLYLRITAELLETCMNQMRGSIGYSDFLSELNRDEIDFMKLLAFTTIPISAKELGILVLLDRLQDALVTGEISYINKTMIEDQSKLLVRSEEILQSIIEKDKITPFTALSKVVKGIPFFNTNDEWISTYLRMNWSRRWFDIDKGFIPGEGGIFTYRGPISSMIHSIFFPRLAEGLRGTSQFKIRAGLGDVDESRLPRRTGRRKFMAIEYNRSSDRQRYHYVFNLSSKFDEKEEKNNILSFLATLRELDLVTRYQFQIISR